MKKLIYTLAIYFILFIQTVCASYSWVQLTTLSSFERDRATGFSIGDKLYFGTGYINSIASSDFWEYNTLTGTWTQIADIVGNRHGAVGFPTMVKDTFAWVINQLVMFTSMICKSTTLHQIVGLSRLLSHKPEDMVAIPLL
ncbi:MAG: hypothetical protein IPN54_06245 [Bacteroidetes bacterium]|nr:hypothetical protein [Bacteroidota bacterium]